jgi:hypothetical protein
MEWHGWHAFRRGLATNLHRLGVSDKVIQQIPAPCERHHNDEHLRDDGDSDAAAAMKTWKRHVQLLCNQYPSPARG